MDLIKKGIIKVLTKVLFYSCGIPDVPILRKFKEWGRGI